MWAERSLLYSMGTLAGGADRNSRPVLPVSGDVFFLSRQYGDNYLYLTRTVIRYWAAAADKALITQAPCKWAERWRLTSPYNRRHPTPYSGRSLTQVQGSLNYYLPSCLIAVEKAFGILISRVETLWSPLRFSLLRVALVILVACKLHKFIINNEWSICVAPMAEDKMILGAPIVQLQNVIHADVDYERKWNLSRETSNVREAIATWLNQLGLTRPQLSSTMWSYYKSWCCFSYVLVQTRQNIAVQFLFIMVVSKKYFFCLFHSW